MSERFVYSDSIEHERELCSCGSITKCEFSSTRELHEEDNSNYQIEGFKVLTCQTCHSSTVLFYSGYGNEDEDEYYDYELKGPRTRKYTRNILHGPTKLLHDSIPSSIADIIGQAEAILIRSPRASFILCRAVLEETCSEFKIPTETTNNKGEKYFIPLNARLIQLFKQEEMPEELKTIILGIKDLGNEGAHSDHLTFTKQVKVQDAENLLTLLKYVLERLYVDRYRQKEAAEILGTLKSKILNPDASL